MLLSEDVVLHHIDFKAAEDPEESGRPLERFVDATDHGWCALLCQRLEPHGAPRNISCAAKGFDVTQLRWSAMERELYALWQGVVSHEKFLKGFKTRKLRGEAAVTCCVDYQQDHIRIGITQLHRLVAGEIAFAEIKIHGTVVVVCTYRLHQCYENYKEKRTKNHGAALLKTLFQSNLRL